MAAATSVIRATGQLWKLGLAIGALVAGSIAPLWPEATGLDWTSGTVLAVAGYAFGCLAIRCPGCGDRWFWSAALDAGLYGPLFGKPACPKCGKGFAPGAGHDHG
jgi:hypothetical protein